MTRRVFVIATGAGAGAQQELWRRPGCSAFFSGAAFPYAPDQIDELLGFTPEQYCSEPTAIDLALAAYYRAWLPGTEAIGVALTASVASVTPHRGEHRIHAAVMTAAGVFVESRVLPKGAGAEARALDGAIADALVTRLVAHPSGECVTARARECFFARPHFTESGRREPWRPRPGGVLFPGAFHPPHPGHLEPAAHVRATFHVTADPPHKAPLTLAELVQRAKLLHGRPRLFSEGDALYIDKARRNPQSAFLLGADALERMLDPKWGPDPEALLREFRQLGTTFLVIDRGELSLERVLSTQGVRAEFRSLFASVDGRWDTSSTALRVAAAAG